MAAVEFAPMIQHFMNCPPMKAFGSTVGELLEIYFQKYQQVRGYIFDEQARLRPLVAVFVDGEPVADRVGLTDPVHLNARIFIQAMPLDTEYENLD
jgi:hypothetical protein